MLLVNCPVMAALLIIRCCLFLLLLGIVASPWNSLGGLDS